MQSIVHCGAAKVAASVLTVLLQGCESMAVWNFKSADISGQGKGGVMLYLHNAKGDDKTKYMPDMATNAAYPKLQDALDACKHYEPNKDLITIQGSFPGLSAIVPSAGKLLFDLYMDKQARDLETLKASAEKSYYVRMVLDANTLQNALSRGSCFVLERTSEDDKVPKLVAVLALERAPKELELFPSNVGKAFAFRPIYVAARSAVAVTRQADEAKISVSFALSVRGIGKQDNGLPAFAQIGEAATTVPSLPLGKPITPQGASCYAKECPQSDPIPLVTDIGAVVVGVGVTEKGDIGVDFDAMKNELSAIKAAIGPVVSDVLKEK